MKKIIISISILLIFLNSYSQKIDTIPTQKDVFVKTLVKLIDATKRSELKDLTKEFESNVKKEVYSDLFYSDLATITNKMILMRGKAYPQLSKLLGSYMKMYKLNLELKKWNEWNTVLNETIDKSSKGNTKTTLKFLYFS